MTAEITTTTTAEVSYFQQRMTLLGVTEANNTVQLLTYNAETGKNELQARPIFTEGPKGIDILVYTLARMQRTYAKEGSKHKTQTYKITRLEEPVVKKDGSIMKYMMPKGQATMPFFPPALIDKYDAAAAIPVLYITEGYFKAFKGQLHGIDIVGLPSITCMKDRETGKLHEDIRQLIIKCKVQRVVWLVDGDCRDLSTKEIADGADLYKRPHQFFRTVQTFHELLSSFAEVQKYFAHINSEDIEGKPKGLDDLLCAVPGSIDEIVKESKQFDKVTGNVYNGEYFVKMNITFSPLRVHKYFMLGEVELFYLHHVERRPDLKEKDFVFNGTLYGYDHTEGKYVIKVPSDAARYFRVGDKYYEFIEYPNKYGAPIKTFDGREKSTIQDDNGKTIFNHIPKYKRFVVVPDHLNYQRTPNQCFNRYAPFEHEPEEGDCTLTLDFIKHIFGSEEVMLPDGMSKVPRWQLGLDYISILYKKPQQILPILSLVSRDRQTGKTTFAKWLNLVFTENMAVVGNEDLAAQFNAHWTSKLIVCCDETKIDKHVVMEKVKSLSTADSIMMNAKGRDQLSMEFFAKFILLSNNEDNFALIEKEEIRFWVIKVPSTEGFRNTELLDDLKEEIPAFLHFLNVRQMVTEKKERHWFATSLLKTEALDKVVANSKPNLEKQLRIAIGEMFDSCPDAAVLTFPLEVITSELIRNKDKNYVKDTLHRMGYKTSGGRGAFPRHTETHVQGEGIVQGVTFVKFNTRYYEFVREDFVKPDASMPDVQPASTPAEPTDLPF